MLSDNIKTLRTAQGMSQVELARKLNVVRQTISKWEKGLSVPDADMLILLARALGSSPAALLGEAAEAGEDRQASASLAEELAALNARLACQTEKNRRLKRRLSLAVLALALMGMLIQLLPKLHSWYMNLSIRGGGSVIIGGADGPTAIFLTRQGPDYPALALLAALLILGVWGLVKTRR